MSVKMIADFRRKPSLARRQAVKRERVAVFDQIVKEEIERASVGIDYGNLPLAAVWIKGGVVHEFVNPSVREPNRALQHRDDKRRRRS